MSVREDFHATLSAYAPLTAIVGDRIALNAVPEGQKPPLVVYSCREERILGIGSNVLAEEWVIEVQCWGVNAAQAESMSDAVVAAVDLAPAEARACVLTRATTFEADLGLDGELLTVEWSA